MFYKSNTFFYGIYFVLGLYLIFTSIKAQTQENKWICIEKHRTENQLFIKESNGIPFFLFLGHANSQNDDPHISTVQICALFTIRLYKRCVSPYLGTKCNFYPSCSEFGFQAYKKYGFFIGTLMTTDRVSRDHGFIRFEDYFRNKSGSFLDPVEDNDIFKTGTNN